jgi:hypothetical protein
MRMTAYEDIFEVNKRRVLVIYYKGVILNIVEG